MAEPQIVDALQEKEVPARSKTFYLETFGCQMNVHDSEKVIGTLVQQGYRQVETEEDADLILYNTCSIRDKAEQKVFHRLNDFKKLTDQGKRFGVLGCVAGRLPIANCRKCWYAWSLVTGASPGWTIARQRRHLKPSSRSGPTPIGAISRLLKVVTNFVRTAWSHLRAAKSGAGLQALSWPRRAAWRMQVIPRSSYLDRM